MTRGSLALAGALLLVACTSTGAAEDATTVPGETSTGGSGTAAPGPTPSPGEEGEMTCWVAPPETGSSPISFQDVTAESGLVEPLLGMHGHAAAFGDLNDDGLPDLVVGTFGDRETEAYRVREATGPSPDRLLVTRPELTMVPDWSEELGRTSGAVFADFDLDGDDDLLLVRHAGRDGDFPVPSRLYANVEGTLQPHSEPLPADFRGRTPAVADYDGDGLLDVYVSEDNSGDTGGLLLRNEGDLEFADATAGSGLEGVLALSAATGDLNRDLAPDLATSTAVFVNDGDMRFTDVTPDGFESVPIGEEDDPAGVAIGDLDGDGWADIVVGQHYRATVEFDSEVPIRVFRNAGGETPVFEEVGGIAPLPTLAPHVALADMDNDGRPDIVTTASAGDGTTPAVYRNTTDGGAISFEVSAGLGSDQYWIGGPVADVDHDGRLDVFAVEWEPSLPSILFRNNGDSGHWLEVSIDVPGGGIGSLVTVVPEGGPASSQEIGVGGGYSSGRLPVAHFGLGGSTVAAVSITQRDGTVVDLGEIPADQHLRWPGGC